MSMSIMNFVTTELRRLYEKLSMPLLFAFGVFYILFHVLSGERGVYALLKEERKLDVLKTELSSTINDRKKLEHRVRLMSANSLDTDLLDEESRLILDTSAEDEVVIPLKK